VNPRPVTPDETLRYFKATGGPPATHVKFVVATNQCTGQASYNGDQDNDPTNNSDCTSFVPTAPPGQTPPPPRSTEVHATELQVFGSKADVQDSRAG
jgi:hypothetical protein